MSRAAAAPAHFASARTHAPGDARTAWRWTALGLLSVRFVQGFIYWGGGSRRFIYAPGKLDPDSPSWMANKFQSAMPGAILGTDHVIAWLLHHFWALYPALVTFSALELLCGLGLMAGFLTRLSALGSIFFSIALMLTFGWQGSTCIDEWTMAASTLAMGVTLALLGAGAFSVDGWLARRWPSVAGAQWYRWIGGGEPLPLSDRAFAVLALVALGFTVVFTVGTYSYYRGSVVTPFHSGPVSASKHHYRLTDARLDPQGGVAFHLYLDGGTAAVPAHAMQARLVDDAGRVLEAWDAAALAALPPGAIHNDFAFNTVKAGPFGLVAEAGAHAQVRLPAQGPVVAAPGLKLELTDVDGKTFSAPVQGAAP